MADSNLIIKLYDSVLEEDVKKYNLKSNDIRVDIQNMKEVYKPNPLSCQSDSVDVANYNTPSARCAYLHKYAPLHTALVAEMMRRAIRCIPGVFNELVLGKEYFKMCSLGGGPGSDVVGTLIALVYYYGVFPSVADVVDYMAQWKITFGDIIQELEYGYYGDLSKAVSSNYFSWNYIGANLLGPMHDQVHRAIVTSDMITMVKFVSAASCKSTSAMLKKIFNSMKPGAVILYLDNAGGGFHQIMIKEAQTSGLETLFGPLMHQHYKNEAFNKQRFGYTSCFETKITTQIFRKTPNYDLFQNYQYFHQVRNEIVNQVTNNYLITTSSCRRDTDGASSPVRHSSKSRKSRSRSRKRSQNFNFLENEVPSLKKTIHAPKHGDLSQNYAQSSHGQIQRPSSHTNLAVSQVRLTPPQQQHQEKALSIQQQVKLPSNLHIVKSLSSQQEVKPLSSQQEVKRLSSQQEVKLLSSQQKVKPLSSQQEVKPLSSQPEVKPPSSHQEVKPLASQYQMPPLHYQQQGRYQSSPYQYGIHILPQTISTESRYESHVRPQTISTERIYESHIRPQTISTERRYESHIRPQTTSTEGRYSRQNNSDYKNDCNCCVIL